MFFEYEVDAAKWLYQQYQATPALFICLWLLTGYVFGQLTCITQRLWDPSKYRPTLVLSDLYGSRVFLSLLGPVSIYMLVMMQLFEIPRLIGFIFAVIGKVLSYLPGAKAIAKRFPSGDKVLIK